MMIEPLKGLVVLAVEQYGAGPFGTMLLSELGADVIKIEEPGVGDVARYVPPYTGDRDSLYFQSLNRGKQSVELDLKQEKDWQSFLRLLRDSHAVFNNLRGDQAARRGLDYTSLKQHKPAIVCAHLSGYGRVGERTRTPGYDYVIQGYSGWMSLTGEPDGPPQKSGLSLVDLSAGAFAALGLLAAVRKAEMTGLGGDVDVSLLDTALSLLTYVGAWHLTRGYVPQRYPDSSHPSQVPSQILPTADGHLVVMCAKDKFFVRLVEVFGAPELATDPRFATFEGRMTNRVELVRILKDLSSRRTTAEWLEAIGDRLPCAPINTVPEALADPRVRDSGLIVETPHKEFGTVRHVSSPIRVDGKFAAPRQGPALGSHSEEVARKLAEPGDAAAPEHAPQSQGGKRAHA